MLSSEQILALAPDASSAKAGSGQANPSHWSELGANEVAIWGLCQGSGKLPYRTQIEIATPAFKCTCPSRKFPCKHGLGLYLLFAKQQTAFTSALPDWVQDWLESRNQRQEKKIAKEAEQSEAAAALTPEQLAQKEKAAQKRQDKRQQNVQEGLLLLDRWLTDLAREGLLGLRAKPSSQWEAIAARMVDAQAPGIAQSIRRISSLLYATSQSNWEAMVARELGYLAMLSQAFQVALRDEAGEGSESSLSNSLVRDIRLMIGWTATQEEALAQAGVEDVWLILGVSTHFDDKVTRRQTYLRGIKSGKLAMYLQFAAGNQPLGSAFIPGMYYQGSLHYYPASLPLRVQLGQSWNLLDVNRVSTETLNHAVDSPAGLQSEIPKNQSHSEFIACLDTFSHQLASNPWLESMPIEFTQVRIAPLNDETEQTTESTSLQLQLIDPHGVCLPISKKFKSAWQLFCIGGGHPCHVFGTWNGREFMPLSVLSAPGLDAVYSFDGEGLA